MAAYKPPGWPRVHRLRPDKQYQLATPDRPPEEGRDVVGADLVATLGRIVGWIAARFGADRSRGGPRPSDSTSTGSGDGSSLR